MNWYIVGMIRFAIHLVFPLLFSVVSLLAGLSAACAQTSGADAKFRLAQGLEQAGDYERAASLYRELRQQYRSTPAYFEGLRRVLAQLKKYDELIALMQEQLAAAPENPALRAQLGSVFYRAGMEGEAYREWDSAVTYGAVNANRYRIVANVMVENRLLDRAVEVYRRGRAACRDSSLFTFELVQLLTVSMEYHEAALELIQWYQMNPTQGSLVQSRLALFTGKPEGRAAAIEAVHQAQGNRSDARLEELLGWLYLEGREYDRALEVYRSLDRSLRSEGVTVLGFADRARREGAFSIAAEAYRVAIATPLSPQKLPAARFGYAMTLKDLAAVVDTATQPLKAPSSLGNEGGIRYRDALLSFRRIIEDYPISEWSAKSNYQIGLIQFEKFFDLDQAIASFRRVEEGVSGIPQIRYDVALKIGNVLIAQGDTAGAAGQFRIVGSARDATPDQADEAGLRLAELDFFAGRFHEAQDRLSDITVNLRADYANDALALQAFLQSNAAVSPEALRRYARAQFLTRQHKNTEAIAILNEIVEHDPGGVLAPDALLAVGTLQADAGLYREAILTYTRLGSGFGNAGVPTDRVQFTIAEIFEFGLKDHKAALAAYEKLLTDFPASIWVATSRKRIRTLRGDPL